MACLATTVGAIILSGFINLTAANKDPCDLHAAVGQSLTLPFVHEGTAKSDVFRWTHNSTIIFYRQHGRVSVGRPEDMFANGSLLLRNLQISSAGTYQVNVLNVNGTLAKAWTGRLCVTDRVPKPQVTYTCDLKSGAVHLSCRTTAKSQPPEFSWTLDGKALAGETKPTLSISLARLEGERSFACGAANGVSREKSDAVRPTCGSPPSPATICLPARAAAAAAAGGAGVILLLLGAVVALCRSRARTRGLRLNKGEPDPAGGGYMTLTPTQDSAPKGPDSPPGACYERVSQTEAETDIRPAQLSTGVGGQPSPVPKPRTKAPQTPNI
ncbi:cd2 [Pungitius sinensis]